MGKQFCFKKNKKYLVILSVFLTFFFLTTGASAATKTWTGGGADNNASTGGNWGGTAPVNNDVIIFDSGSKDCTWDTAASGTLATFTISSTYTGIITLGKSISVTGFTQSSGTFVPGTYTITSSGNLTVTGGTYSGGSETLSFTGGVKTINASGQTLGKVTWNLSGAMNVSAGTSFTLVDSLTTAGDLVNAGTITGGTGTWTYIAGTMKNTGSGIITAPNVDLRFPVNLKTASIETGASSTFKSVRWNLSSYSSAYLFTVATGTVITVGDGTFTTDGSLLNYGTVNGGTGTWNFNAGSLANVGPGTIVATGTDLRFPSSVGAATINIGPSSSFKTVRWNLTSYASAYLFTVATGTSFTVGDGPFTTNGSLTNYGTVNGGTGTWTFSGTSITNNGTLNLGGTVITGYSTLTMSSTSTTNYLGQDNDTTVTLLNGTHGTMTVNNAGTIFVPPANLTTATTSILAGTLSLSGYNFTTIGLINDGLLRLKGSEVLTITNSNTDSGTIEYLGDGDSIADNFTINSINYYNLNISSIDSNDVYNLPATLNISGNFNVSGGIINEAGSGLVVQSFNTVGTTTWTVPDRVTSVEVLVVGGGGGGNGGTTGVNYGDGGAGGDVNYNGTYAVTPGESVSVTVGSGGTAVNQGTGGVGGNSVFGTITSYGGGTTNSTSKTGGANTNYIGGTGSGGGYPGGGGAGGGGSGSGKNAGVGYQTEPGASITGTHTHYAGGGASTDSSSGGTYEAGGGAGNRSGVGGSGTVNTGGGGGGGTSAAGGGAGGSGKVIIKYIQSAAPDSGNTINLAGDLTKSAGSLNTSSAGLVLNGANQTITLNSTTTFGSLTKVASISDQTLTFGTTGNIAVIGTTTLQGTASYTLSLHSTVAGSQWYIDPQGARAFAYLDIKDSNNTNAVVISAGRTNSVDSGNNTNWSFDVIVIWDGSSSTDWFTAANWDTNTVPTTTDSVIIDGSYTNAPTLSVTAGSVTVKSLTIGSSANSTTTISYGTSTKKLIVTGNLTIGAYGVLTHADNSTSETHALWVDVGGNLTVDSGGKIDVIGRGYDGKNGPGKSVGGTYPYVVGGSYGGIGGTAIWTASTPGPTYGSYLSPVNLGSGGGYAGDSGPGGGAIILNITGSSIINGTVSANGQNLTGVVYGAGSGGSVYITSSSISGTTGSIIANGGNGGTNRDGGGGGRVSVILTGTNNDFTDYSGLMTAYGGVPATGTIYGAAGTVYKQSQAQGTGQGTLIVDNNDLVTLTGVSTAIPAGQTWDIYNLTLQNKGILDVGTGRTLILRNDNTSSDSDNNADGIRMSGGALTLSSGALTVHDWSMIVSTTTAVTGNITVKSGGIMTHDDNSTAETYKLNLSITGNFTLDSGGTINADGLGYDAGYGPGRPIGGSSPYVVGGSYGGIGGTSSWSAATPGSTYGSITAPINLGSSGGYSGSRYSGGGAIMLVISGVSTINGIISANGYHSTSYGNGSGGSVYITTASISGTTGVIRANGGDSTDMSRDGGGGGRVAVILTGTNNDFTDYSGLMTAYGGDSAYDGAAGTVYKQVEAQGTNVGSLTIDNNNLTTAAGVVTAISVSTTDTLVGSLILTANKAGKLTIDPGQTLTIQGGNTTLTVGTGTTLTNNGTLGLGGTTFTNAGTITMPATSTVNYLGQGDDSAVTMLNLAHGNITLNNTGTTFNLPATNFDVNGNLTITAGALDATVSNYILKLAGNFINNAGAGGLVPRAGTVTLDGGNQSILGSSTFYNLTKSTTTAYTLTFGDDTTQTIGTGGRLTLRGSSTGKLSLRTVSNNGTAKFNIDDNGSESVSSVNVKDGTALHRITANQSIDSGGNTNWVFGSFVMWQFQDF